MSGLVDWMSNKFLWLSTTTYRVIGRITFTGLVDLEGEFWSNREVLATRNAGFFTDIVPLLI